MGSPAWLCGYFIFMLTLVTLVVVAAVFALFLAVSLRGLRRGGLGPPITMPPLTRKGRERMNRSYAKHGWAKPFDEQGRMLPASQRQRPSDS